MLEVSDIFRAAAAAYRQVFGSRMPPTHLKAMRDIEQCRTSALGGHLRRCDCCHKEQYSYHSCRNRHCPKCHTDQTRRWLHHQRSRLLSCPYFLLTFTLPAPLRRLARSHQKLLYGILMTQAAKALMKLAADERYLGARPGVMAVLHTWTRAMLYHPHVHMLVTAGGLTRDGNHWRTPRHGDFLVPCRALSVIFRGKVRAALKQAGFLDQVPGEVWRSNWVVHARHAGTGDKVLEYLSRYLFRIAMANSRLESFRDGQVTFRYRDNRSGQTRRCTLTAQQFISRFLQHVLPRGLTKVRYYGFYSPSRKADLDRTRCLLSGSQAAVPPGPVCDPPAITITRTTSEVSPDAHPDDPPCPFCHLGILRLVAHPPRARCPP